MSDYEQRWKAAKKAFEAATGKKKPNGGFLGLFHASGMVDACKALDQAFDKDDAAMQKALVKYRKEAADYGKTLNKAEGSGDYKAEIKKLLVAIQLFDDEFQKELETKLPVVVVLPDSISSSSNAFRRAKSKYFEPRPVAVEIGFAERSVRVRKLIEREVDGLVQILVLEASNRIGDMETAVADLVAQYDKKLEALKAPDEKALEKLALELESKCHDVIDAHRAQALDRVERLCADWFKKHDSADAYKKGFVKAVVVGTVGVGLGVSAMVLSGGAALPALIAGIGSQCIKVAQVCSAVYKFARDLSKTEGSLIEQTNALQDRFQKAGVGKIESLEMLGTLGLPLVTSTASLKGIEKEYSYKCVAYEEKNLAPLKQTFENIFKLVEKVGEHDKKLKAQYAAQFDKIFDVLAQENALMAKRADLRIATAENLEVLNGTRKDFFKKLNSVTEAGKELATIAGVLNDIRKIGMALA